MVVVEQASLLERADLSRPIPENARKLASQVNVEGRTVEVGVSPKVKVHEHTVFIREATPPGSNYSKACVLFLHGQSYTSSTWEQNDTLRTIAALGYHSIAPDLPGCGKTRGPAVCQQDKPSFLLNFIASLGVKQVMVVAASMSSQYILPLMSRDIFTCVVGVALSNTHEIGQPSAYRTPVLVLWGDRDTSLGPSSAANLRCLPNSRLEKIASAGHACYLNNPKAFQELCVNFFELVRNYHSL